MNWPQLLSWNRLCEPRRFPIEASRPPWQIDFDRIIFSSAFRRLQDKAQVFPLSDSDYVRTRLTHSLEVSSVARTLGTMVGKGILDRHGEEPVLIDPSKEGGETRRLQETFWPSDFGAILATAALAHDLGNPPFGHSGEDAVRHWFTTSPAAKSARTALRDSQFFADFEHWEGNAQGFRILTRLQLYRSDGGMRLTYATLGAFTKYPCESSAMSRPREGRPTSQKKFGFFQTEASLFDEVALATGLLPRPDTVRAWARHPLAFLMEAADDLCYRIVDFEDGFRLGRLNYEEVERQLRRLTPKVTDGRLAQQGGESSRVGYLRAVAINEMVSQVAETFMDNEEAALAGSLEGDLIGMIPSADVLEEIKDISVRKVFSEPRVVQTEAAGFEIISGLLDIFWEATEARATGRDDHKAKKLLQVAPVELPGPNGTSPGETAERLMKVLDFVTGMTDSYALSLFRKLKGIALPV